MTESNGVVRTFTQPYSAVPYMLREGRGKFSLSAGRYHSGESVRSPEFLQGTLFYGLTAGFTLYGGTQLAGTIRRGRWAWAAVLASSDRWEGCHPAVTRTPSGKRYTGHCCALSIRKFCQLGTAFSLASYRYSSSGYYDFAEASALESAWAVDNRRRREELSVSQSLGGPAVWRFPPGRRSTGIGRVGMRRCTLGSTAPERDLRAWAITTPAPAASKNDRSGHSISIFRWVVRCPTAR